MASSDAVILFVIAQILSGVNGFYPNQFALFLSGNDYTHADITEIGILQAVAVYFESIPPPGSSSKVAAGSLTNISDITARKLYDAYYGNISSETRFQEAINDVITQNNKVDQEHHTEAKWYVNGEQIAQAHALLVQIRDDLLQVLAATTPSYEKARELIGQYLHVLQSFYSNTNWVELRHKSIYEDFGLPGKTLMKISMPSTDTCKGCGKGAFPPIPCFMNMISQTELTSGYREGQDVPKPFKDPHTNTQGKCSHGGLHDTSGTTSAALGGINKDTRDSSLSPHNFKHEQAGTLAIEHTRYFLTDPTNGILKTIGNDKFEELFQLKPGNSMVFVIDTSGSMGKVVATVQQKTQEIINLTKGTSIQPFDYILVTFNDPESNTNVQETKDPNTILSWINNIHVSGGGDCPEYTLSGLQAAVVKAKPNSHIYVFTDATPKDPEKQQFILSIIAEKNLHIDFVITGSCDNSNSHFVQRRSVHSQMVQGYGQSTGRQFPYRYFEVKGNESRHEEKEVSETSKRFRVILLQKTLGRYDPSLFQVPVDTTMRNVMIQVEGDIGTPYLTIQKPDGTFLTIDGHEAFEEQYAGNAIQILISKPSPGVWSIYRLGNSDWTVNITGESTLIFSSKLLKPSLDEKYDLLEVKHTERIKQIAIAVTSDEKVFLSRVLLIDELGDTMMSSIFSAFTGGISTKSLVRQVFLPDEKYRIAIEGHDDKGFTFRREHDKLHSVLGKRSTGIEIHRRHKRSTVTSFQGIDYYTWISQASGGHVFQSSNANIGTAVDVLKGSLSSTEVNIIRDVIKGGSTGCASINIPIDRTCKSFTLRVQGDKGLPVPLVMRPDGTTAGINGVDSTKDVLGSNYVILRYKYPVPGTWTVRRQDTYGWDLEVTAESEVDFSSKFLELGPDGYSLFEIKGRPIAGDNMTTSVTVNNFVNITNLEKLVLLDRYGDEISRYDLQKRSVQKGRGVFSTEVIIPDQAFQVAVDGIDDRANPFRRVHTSLINTVAIKVENLPIQGSFYLDEQLQVPYIITNVGGGTTMVNVTISDDQNLAQRPTSQVFSLMSGENSTSYFVMYADSNKVTVGTTTTITITAQPMKIIGAGFQFVVVRLTTEKRNSQKIDTIPPHCGLQASIQGSCPTDECLCAQTFIHAAVTIWDEGDGLASIDAVGVGSGNFTHTGFVVGDTKVNNTVNGTVSVDCCRKVVYINVVDNASLPTQCKIDVNPSYQNKGCNKTTKDTTPPHCGNLTNLHGLCGTDDCKCSKTMLTTELEIWDVGDGLSTIDVVGIGNGTFTHSPFVKGDVKAYNTVNATLSVDCCRTMVFVNVMDMASLPGQCAIDVNPNYKGCNNNKNIDTKPPKCVLSNLQGVCGADDCTCQQSTVTADVQIWDTGDGLSTIHAVGLGTGTFSHTGFVKGDVKANNTVNGSISVDCCREEVYVNVVDLAGLPGQCILEVNKNYTGCVITTPSSTSSTSTTSPTSTPTSTTTVATTKNPNPPPTCKLTSKKDKCVSDSCKCNQTYIKAEMTVYDEVDGLQNITTAGLGNGTFSHSNFSVGDTKVRNNVTVKIRVDCCRKVAHVNVQDRAGQTGQCIIDVNPNYESCDTNKSSKQTTSDEEVSPIAVAGIGVGAGAVGVAFVGAGAYLIKTKFYSKSVSPE